MSQTPKDEFPKPKSALDVAVNQLVRASVGGVPSTISDESLDKYVADLILKEAAVKNKQYNEEGVRAYLPHTGTPPCNLPKTNKRFLLNVVKNMSNHNQALIRKTELEAAARRRALNRSRRHDSDDERRYSSSRRRRGDRHRRKDHKTSKKSKDYDRYYSEDDIYSSNSSSERDRKSSHKERKRSSRSSNHDYVKSSSSSRKKSTRRSVSPISSSSDDLDNISSRLNGSELRKEQTNLSIDSSSNKSTSQINVIRKGRGEVSNGSKMDKYFRKDYNPMFDIEPFIGENVNWFNNYDEFEQSITEKSFDDDDTKKKKKKRKEKSKHKKEKHKSSSNNKSKKKRKRDSDSGISSDSDEDNKKSKRKDDIDLKPVSIREWDKPKLISGSWDPDKTI